MSAGREHLYPHLIWCHGGPLDGRVVEMLGEHPSPEPLLLITLDGVSGEYRRVPAPVTRAPGDSWEYVPAEEPAG
jgi:hypothetical protein